MNGRQERDGLVHFDRDKLWRQLRRLGLSKTALADRADVSRNTVLAALAGRGVFPNSALLIAQALGFEDVCDLLPSMSQEKVATEVTERPISGEWRPAEYLGPWVTASNGLQFRVCRMQHEFVEARQGRGKWYDLLHLSSRDRESLRTHLLRHPTVCERIGPHAHIADNISTSPARKEDSWWVIDRWIEGTTLSDQLENGPFPRDQLPRLMCQIALGLKALHAAEVVFRELAPSRVILAKNDGRAVLTDFELAKLLDTGPTVSAAWPDDVYRAPEVEAGSADKRSDLYSWARICVHAATGQRPSSEEGAHALTNPGLPAAVWRLATKCLAKGPSARPESVQDVLHVLQAWSP